MSGSEDDNASIVEEDDVEIIENIQPNPETEEGTENPEEANENPEEGAAESEDKKEVKVKRVRNPQPKLDAERLKGPRGLRMVQTLFENVKFKGRGHEEEDLGVLMKNYEYWCHRLFPKFPFDDCLERMEKLGAKRPTQTYLKRIRSDMLLNEDVTENQEEVAIANADADDTEDVFTNDPFDSLLPPQTQAASSVSDRLTDDQLERIRINRERAQRVRQQMLIRNQNATVASQNDFTPVQSQNSVTEESFRLEVTADVHTENTSQDSEGLGEQTASEAMSVDSEIPSQNSIVEKLCHIEIAADVHPSSQDSGSLGETTSTDAMSVDSQIPSQNSIVGESCHIEVAADIHAPNTSEDSEGLGQKTSSGNSNLNTFDEVTYASQESMETTHIQEKESQERSQETD